MSQKNRNCFYSQIKYKDTWQKVTLNGEAIFDGEEIPFGQYQLNAETACSESLETIVIDQFELNLTPLQPKTKEVYL